MPLVQIDLTESEAERIDAIADAEKRARKNQCHIMILDRLEQLESANESALAEKP